MTYLVQGSFFGVLLAVGLCNLYVAVAVRDRSAPWFLGYVAALGANGLFGGGKLDVWPDVAFVAFLLFARSFLQTRTTAPRWDRVLVAAVMLEIVADAIRRLLPGDSLAGLVLGMQFAGLIATMCAGVVRMRAGFHPAQFFVIAFAPAFAGETASIAYQTYLPGGHSFFAANAVEFGIMAQCVILSFSLLDRIRILDAERAQTEAELERTERRNAELHTLASSDPLTGIYNRLAFFEALDVEIEAVRDSVLLLGVLYADLDGFKSINDRYGHRIGDLLLQVVARRLENAVRPSDTVARLGGDEFAVLVTGVTSASVLESVRDNVAHILDAPITIEGIRLTVGLSIGMAMYPRDAQEADGLIEVADRQMYAAKDLRAQALGLLGSTIAP